MTRTSWLVALLSLPLLMAVVACEEDTDPDVSVAPTPRVPGVYAPQGDTRIEAIVITDDGIDPEQVTITAAAQTQVQVANRGSAPCAFFVGDLLIGLDVPPGEGAKMGLTVPQDRSGDTITIGCAGDPDRQGNAVIEFTGVLPGAGR